jgi:predicted nucleotidyltransferase component of viral defense system
VSSARDGLARSVQVRLVRHAKLIGVDPNLVLTRYAAERFLYRLSRSPHADRFILKGALLLLAWLGDTLRPTRDANLLGSGDLPDETLVKIVRDVCAVDVEPDAMRFLPASVAVSPIREQDAYGGRRVALQARLGVARLGVQIDVGIGDAVTPGPEWLEYPSLIDAPRPRLRAYTRETVVAEKLHGIVLLGARNSRMKDYFDLRALAHEGRADSGVLAEAIRATFMRRGTPLPSGMVFGLRDEFARDSLKQSQWSAFLAKNRLQAPAWDVVVREVRSFLEVPLRQALGRRESA